MVQKLKKKLHKKFSFQSSFFLKYLIFIICQTFFTKLSQNKSNNNYIIKIFTNAVEKKRASTFYSLTHHYQNNNFSSDLVLFLLEKQVENTLFYLHCFLTSQKQANFEFETTTQVVKSKDVWKGVG